MRGLWIVVGAGGFLGSVARYAVGGLAQRLAPEALFPWGTLAVNVIGCLLIGFAVSLGETKGWLGPGGRAFLLVGLLGGFTTFSSFGYETWNLVRDGQLGFGLANACANMVLGLLAVLVGAAAARVL